MGSRLPQLIPNSETIDPSSPLQNPSPVGKFLFNGQFLDVKKLGNFSFASAVIRFEGGFVVFDVVFGLAVELHVVVEAEDVVVFFGFTMRLAAVDIDKAEAMANAEANTVDLEVTGIEGRGLDGSIDDDAVCMYVLTSSEEGHSFLGYPGFHQPPLGGRCPHNPEQLSLSPPFAPRQPGGSFEIPIPVPAPLNLLRRQGVSDSFTTVTQGG